MPSSTQQDYPFTSEPVVQLKDVSVVYPDGVSEVRALDHVDFELNLGQATAVVGESGSGKSTLLSVIGGLIVPTSGEVKISGHAHLSSEKERSQLRKNFASIVFQAPNLLGSLNVREQLLMAEHIRGLRKASMRRAYKRADELLDRVGLGGLGDRKITELSGGQRQRVNIARALMKDPQVLLADEPTSALDRATSDMIIELLVQLTKEDGIATMVVTHDRGHINECDRAVEMRDGKMMHVEHEPL